MKLELHESFPGELGGTPENIIKKAQLAFDAALESLGCETCGGLHKALGRGGELQIIEDLTQRLATKYANRLEKLRDDLTEAIGNPSEQSRT